MASKYGKGYTSVGDKNKNEKLYKVQEEIDDVRDVMEHNIESVLERAGKIEVIVDKSDKLRENSQIFNKNSKSLRRNMCLKNCKITTIIVLVVMAILIILFLIIYFGTRSS